MNKDLIKMYELESSLSNNVDNDDRESILNEIIKISDGYSMEKSLEHFRSGVMKDIHTLAAIRARTIQALMEILMQKTKELKSQNRDNEAIFFQAKIKVLHSKFLEASCKSLETMIVE